MFGGISFSEESYLSDLWIYSIQNSKFSFFNISVDQWHQISKQEIWPEDSAYATSSIIFNKG